MSKPLYDHIPRYKTVFFPGIQVKWEKDRRFVVSRVLKPEKERAQLSLLEGSEYDYFFFVTQLSQVKTGRYALI